MESYKSEKLKSYDVDHKKLLVGFAKYSDAEQYVAENGGLLVEVGFLDGNDNPVLTNAGGLMDKKLHYLADAGPEYKFIHSGDPAFKQYADELQKIKHDMLKYSPEEKYITDAEFETAEDPIIVLKNDHFESVTSRERSKYLKQTKVYEIGVLK